MKLQEFLDKWINLDFIKSEKSTKVVDKETNKAVIWVTSRHHIVGVNSYYGVSIELMNDFIELMKTELEVW